MAGGYTFGDEYFWQQDRGCGICGTCLSDQFIVGSGLFTVFVNKKTKLTCRFKDEVVSHVDSLCGSKGLKTYCRASRVMFVASSLFDSFLAE